MLFLILYVYDVLFVTNKAAPYTKCTISVFPYSNLIIIMMVIIILEHHIWFNFHVFHFFQRLNGFSTIKLFCILVKWIFNHQPLLYLPSSLLSFSLSMIICDQLIPCFSRLFLAKLSPTKNFLLVLWQDSLLFFLDDPTIAIFDTVNIPSWYSSRLTLHVHLTIVVSFFPIFIVFFS